ncbi:histidine-type phosphatase [Glaciimonas soli]|nr:histidine-type phosphatase [Glaciimonas soli]
MRVISPFSFALVLGLSAINAVAAEQVVPPAGYTLERAVLVMRHGVRPPTKSAQAMASLSDQAWPDDAAWGAAPGELTPHGGLAIRKMGSDLRDFYVGAGLLPALGSIADQTLIWADSADQRTRATGQMLALGLSGNATQPISVGWSANHTDPLFHGLDEKTCPLDPAAEQQAILAQGPLDTPETRSALTRLQAILAPQACQGSAGACLEGPGKLTAGSGEVKISGPLSIGATVSEVLLLEYENGLPMSQVGFGRASRADIEQLQSIHEHTANLTRRTPYIATRRAYALAQFILAALSENNVNSTVPTINAAQRLIVLAGHDTNLSNLAGVFGLDWHMPDQPDVTAPGTVIAFERWRENTTGKTLLRMRLFYQNMEQVRNLSDSPARQIPLQPAACRDSDNCALSHVVSEVKAILPKDCAK